MFERGDGGGAVELYQTSSATPAGALLFVHGNQGGTLLGARELVDNGALARFSSALNVTAAAVSQPGFGASDGPSDFCGPGTQQAIIAAIRFLQKQPFVDPKQIVLYGNSRGAVASAMVATQVHDLRAVVLSGGVYDLQAAFDAGPVGIQQAIEKEAGLSAEAFFVRSALLHVNKIRSEILILHGRHDERASVTQPKAFFDALSAVGVTAALNLFECGHRIPREDTTRVLRAFFKKVFGSGITHH